MTWIKATTGMNRTTKHKRFPHGISTIADLKSAIADYPDDAYVIVQLMGTSQQQNALPAQKRRLL
jgi:hypothetical protein